MTTYLCTLNNLFIVFVNYLVIDIALAKFTNRLETMAMKMIALC
jgi:tRNA A-37 threonylcarbamoyl transferase component Bud32